MLTGVRNHKLLSRLPAGFTATATVQVAGRGRGTNVWVSPPGCLLWSTCLNHPVAISNTAPVVFVQYLMAIAIVEGIKTYDYGYGNVPVKLKWPNDICKSSPPFDRFALTYARCTRPLEAQFQRIRQNRRHSRKLLLLLQQLQPRSRSRTKHIQRRTHNISELPPATKSSAIYDGETSRTYPHHIRNNLQIILAHRIRPKARREVL